MLARAQDIIDLVQVVCGIVIYPKCEMIDEYKRTSTVEIFSRSE